MCSVTHLKKRRCFLLPRKDRFLSPLAACLTNPGDDSRTNTCRCQKNIICGYHRRMRSSAALTETCPSGTVRNTPFLRLEHEIRPPQPEGTKPPRRLRAKPPAPQPAKVFIYIHPDVARNPCFAEMSSRPAR